MEIRERGRIALAYCLSDAYLSAARRAREDGFGDPVVVNRHRIAFFTSEVIWDAVNAGAMTLHTTCGTVTEVSGIDFLVELTIADTDGNTHVFTCPEILVTPVVGARAAARYVQEHSAGETLTTVIELWLTDPMEP
jgi:hypothetical protein